MTASDQPNNNLSARYSEKYGAIHEPMATHISEAILKAMHEVWPHQVKDAKLTLSTVGPSIWALSCAPQRAVEVKQALYTLYRAAALPTRIWRFSDSGTP